VPHLDGAALDLAITMAILIGLVGVFFYGRAVTARPADPLKPRMVPWTLVMIFCAFAILLAIVHLVNGLGYQTGTRLR
jgi:hypothetical protein